jgi:hypothetical protein
LVILGRPFYFGTVVDAELTRRWPIESRITFAMIHICAEVLEGGFDARFGHFELAIVSEGSLLLNLDFGLIAHLYQASIHWRLRKTLTRANSVLLCADLAGPVFETPKDLDSLLMGVLVGDAGPQRLHVADRHDAGVDESRTRWFETLFR